jgi:hypothetical protein
VKVTNKSFKLKVPQRTYISYAILKDMPKTPQIEDTIDWIVKTLSHECNLTRPCIPKLHGEKMSGSVNE